MPIDYTEITARQVHDAVDDVIARAEATLDRMVAVEGTRTFEDTVLPLEQVTADCGDAYGHGPFLSHVHPDPAVREAGSAAEDRLRRWLVQLESRVDLQRALLAYADTDEARALTGPRARLLQHRLRDFRRAGTDLPEERRAHAERLRARLAEIGIAFQRNVDEHRDWIDVTREDLEGLPDSYVENLSPGEADGTYRVSLDYPERYPFLSHARRRELRRRLLLKSWNAAVKDNRPLLEEALDLREQLADLLGYPDWAHYAMEVRMADPEAVRAFYDDLVPPLTAKADGELERMRALLAQDEGDDVVQPWDTYYYDTQIRRRDHGVDQHEVAEHFPLDATLAGLLELTAEVFGLRYERIDDARAWDQEVLLYAVSDADSGAELAHFYADLHPRPGKYNHAAAFTLVPGRRDADGEYHRPVAAIVANFTRPGEGRPSLLRHEEVVTLFHEFGHVLHQCLTTADLVSFSGTSVERDFVEAPSQIMENWCWDADVLQRFARHHRTGAPIPRELVDRLVAARDLHSGLFTLRQCYLGMVDLALHTSRSPRDLDALNREAFEVTRLPFPDEPSFFLASFAHLLGGYDAGYYGYLWALVFGHDMFSRFEQAGVTDEGIGREFRRGILEPGGSEDAAVLLRRFLGREPSNGAFLRKLGLSPA